MVGKSIWGICRAVIELVCIVIAALVLTWLIRTFVCQPFEIPSGSMEDTLEIGDRILSEKVTYYFSDIKQGDIVTFTDPTSSDRTLIKRVIATGGQTVDLRDGVVYVDDVALDESYTDGQASYPLSQTYLNQDISYPYTVPEGYLWVMGDNRGNSADSRYFGAIAADTVSGKAFFVYWPFDDFGFLS
jgi:signal peptidase I